MFLVLLFGLCQHDKRVQASKHRAHCAHAPCFTGWLLGGWWSRVKVTHNTYSTLRTDCCCLLDGTVIHNVPTAGASMLHKHTAPDN